MDLVHGSKMAYAPVPLSHRGQGLEFKYLFTGTDGAAENHVLLLGRQHGFYSPVHRHNFDQVRLAYANALSIAPGAELREGEVGYFPEGVYYGPQDDGARTSVQLVLQFGGATGQGYVSQTQLKAANVELAKRGKFEKGRYVVEGEVDKDGYEALYEHCKGQKMVYPEGRYHSPVMMDPKNFEWKPVKGCTAAWRKNLGVFTERETRLEMLRLEAGGHMQVQGEDAIQFLFVTKGEGQVNGEDWLKESTTRLGPGTAAALTTDSEIEIFRIVTPML